MTLLRDQLLEGSQDPEGLEPLLDLAEEGLRKSKEAAEDKENEWDRKSIY